MKVFEGQEMKRHAPESGKGERFVCPQTSEHLYTIHCSVPVPKEETRT